MKNQTIQFTIWIFISFSYFENPESSLRALKTKMNTIEYYLSNDAECHETQGGLCVFLLDFLSG